jgi:Zc3h12a-like Ribonuclease NYN domain
MEQDLPERRRIVVDGSNIATEGRTMPSLAQLDEAIRAFLEEYPGFTTSDVTVVVDASFGHRIDPSEVAAFDQAVEHGEMITPPAGAIGRGDGFILRIAEKSGALVLSNDSFQEFHAERPWLFESGRLIGGKPVPGVGWIFTPRTPVRGARSRSVTSKSKRGERSADAARDPATDELAEGTELDLAPVRASRASRGRSSKAAPAVDRAAESDDAAGGEPAKTAPRGTKSTKPTKAAKAAKVSKATKTTKAAESAGGAKAAKTAKTTKATKTTRSTMKSGGAEPADGTEPARASKATKLAKAAKKTTAKAAKTSAPAKGAKTARPTKAVKSEKGSPAPARAAPTPTAENGRNRPGSAPEALNEPMTFLTFVADHPVGSTFAGTVVSFTSHGAHIDVDGMLCHVPLRGLADPPPKKARQVLTKGETRQFQLVSLDPARRRAELALPGVEG